MGAHLKEKIEKSDKILVSKELVYLSGLLMQALAYYIEVQPDDQCLVWPGDNVTPVKSLRDFKNSKEFALLLIKASDQIEGITN